MTAVVRCERRPSQTRSGRPYWPRSKKLDDRQRTSRSNSRAMATYNQQAATLDQQPLAARQSRRPSWAVARRTAGVECPDHPGALGPTDRRRWNRSKVARKSYAGQPKLRLQHSSADEGPGNARARCA
jgi:hypothetical protein